MPRPAVAEGATLVRIGTGALRTAAGVSVTDDRAAEARCYACPEMSHVLASFVTLLGAVYSILILLRVVLSWTSPMGGGPFTAFVYQVTEPVLAPIRRLLPPMGGLDWSPFLALLLLSVVRAPLRPLLTGHGHPEATFGVLLSPRAARDEVGPMSDGVVRVRVTRPPADGEANRALIRVLAGALDLPPSALRSWPGRAPATSGSGWPAWTSTAVAERLSRPNR